MAYVDARPLIRYVDKHPDLTDGWVDPGGKGSNWNVFIRANRRLNDARKSGCMRSATMEEIAALLEVHPAQIYGEDYWTMKI